MSLRETVAHLRAASDAAADAEARKPQLIADWQAAIHALNEQIRGWLADLEADGSIRFDCYETEIREEALGLYAVEAMKIQVGQVIVQIQPAGRMIIGAQGRVDMFRQGRSAADERVSLLRIQHQDGMTWKLRLPVKQGMKPRVLEPLDQARFEAALEGILRQ